MSVITVQTYGIVGIFAKVIQFSNMVERSFCLTPDNIHAITVEIKSDRKIVLRNTPDIPFWFSVQVGSYIVANVRYREGRIEVNDNFSMENDQVINRMIRLHSPLVKSSFLHFHLNTCGSHTMNEIAIRLNNSSYATMFMTNFEPLFFRFNSVFTSNRLSSHITPVTNLVPPVNYENMPVNAMQLYDPNNPHAYARNRQMEHVTNITNLRQFSRMLNDLHFDQSFFDEAMELLPNAFIRYLRENTRN